jgi:transposase InsO family protein
MVVAPARAAMARSAWGGMVASWAETRYPLGMVFHPGELIKLWGPWRTAEQVEIATLEYVDWFNHRRLYAACGDIPPAELEAASCRQDSSLTEAALPRP